MMIATRCIRLIFGIFAVAHLANAISTTITQSSSQVQSTNVSYTFNMSLQNSLSSVGKLIVRFPADFETPMAMACMATLNFAKTGNIACSYNSMTRMLAITDGFPLKARFFEFQVSGITNPAQAGVSGPFQVSTYNLQSGSWAQLETEDREVTITTTPGVLQNEALSLPSGTMTGQYSTLTLTLKVQHTVPADGSLHLTLPKWNPLALKEQLYEPYVSASSNPGSVRCSAISGLAIDKPNDLVCIFQQGMTTDTLKVSFAASGVKSNIAPGTTLTLSIEQVRGPPTTSVQTGFYFSTLSAYGNLIDQSDPTKKIELKVNTPLVGSAAQVAITAENASINAVTSLNFEIRTTNPLPPRSTLRISIPAEFDISQITSVVGNGQLRSKMIDFTMEGRVLMIRDINESYIQQFVFIFLTVKSVVNPNSTLPTGTFIFKISDSQGGAIETIDQGVFFTAKPGKIRNVSISASDLMINERDVAYTFTLSPEDDFSSSATLKLTLPDQVTAENLSLIALEGISQDAVQELRFEKFIYITKGFPSGFQRGKTLQFTLKGFVNPPTIRQTDSFQVDIFYKESIDVVSSYEGVALTITCIPSPLTDLKISLSSDEEMGNTSGFLNSEFKVSFSTADDRSIQMGSYILLFIPGDVRVPDLDRVSSSCTILSGFSDEITCSFLIADDSGYLLKIMGGFDSKTSTGKNLSFYLQDIMNPLTTKETGSFRLQIYDASGGMQYNYEEEYSLVVEPSLFSFAFAESQSTVVGVSSIYQLSLTLSVDTPAGAYLQVTLPEELQFDSEKAFTCSAITNISAYTFPCIQHSPRDALISLNDDSFGTGFASNGTTVTVDVGYIKNPPSQKPTSSFRFKTFMRDGQYEYLINQVTKGVIVTSKDPGLVTLTEVNQTGSIELGQPTAIKLKMKTQNPIPAGSQIQLTLSNNFVFDDSFEATLNGSPVEVSVNKIGFQLTLTYSAGIDEILQGQGYQSFELVITKGLRNPTKGPYRYNYFNIQFTYQGYGIDSLLSNQVLIYQDCVGNCDVCSGSLDNCTSCGIDRKTGLISYYFFENRCMKTCPAGLYGAPGYTCKPCELPCTECSMAPNLCTLCDPKSPKPLANPFTLQCYSECPDGTYQDNKLRQCLPCKEPCYTCTSATQCLSCNRIDAKNKLINYFAVEKACYESCPATSVPTPSKKCLACTDNCETCEDLTNKCLTCKEGFLMLLQTCVETCPFGYFRNERMQTCDSAGQLQIPIPFTIIAIVVSIGIGISSFVKGSDKQGRTQPGTAFFQTTLAIVDILLRVNWLTLIIYLYLGDHKLTAGLYLIIIIGSCVINFKLWRRMFFSRYHYENEDKLFSIYCNNYPGTTKFLMNLSYFTTFQAIRLTYSRLLGKKQFMARFSTKRRFYRLIGRLSIIEIVFLYLPSMAINIANLVKIKKGSQLFYFDIDSLILVSYATVLILVVLCLRERLLDSSKLFDWRDLIAKGELKEEPEMESSHGDSRGFDITGQAVEERIEVNSAMGYEERKKVDLYQLEFNSEINMDETPDITPAGRVRRPVTALDPDEYQKLEEKHDKLTLKKDLYEHKYAEDEARVVFLEEEIGSHDGLKKELASRIGKLTEQLTYLQRQIEETERSRVEEVKLAEQRKRQLILQKKGYKGSSLHEKAKDSAKQSRADYRQNTTSDYLPERSSMHSLAELELTDGEMGQAAMSSREQFTLSRNQPVHSNRQMFAQTRDNASCEEQKSVDMSIANIASQEEGDIGHYSNQKDIEANMELKNRHLKEGSAKFGKD